MRTAKGSDGSGVVAAGALGGLAQSLRIEIHSVEEYRSALALTLWRDIVRRLSWRVPLHVSLLIVLVGRCEGV